MIFDKTRSCRLILETDIEIAHFFTKALNTFLNCSSLIQPESSKKVKEKKIFQSGMNQHVRLGELIYETYALTEKFLSKKYDPREVCQQRFTITNCSII